MRAIFIDPFAREVTEIDVPEKDDGIDLDAMYALMGCDTLDVACLEIGGEPVDCYVDDNGLFAPDQAFFLIAGRPLAGKALLFGRTDCGECAPVRASLDAVRAAIQWANRRYAEAAIEMQTQAAMAHTVAHGEHVEPIGSYGFLSLPSTLGDTRSKKD